jgi:hypothetical protein
MNYKRMNKVALFFVIGGSAFVGWELGRLSFAPQTMNLFEWSVLAINAMCVFVNVLNFSRQRDRKDVK